MSKSFQDGKMVITKIRYISMHLELIAEGLQLSSSYSECQDIPEHLRNSELESRKLYLEHIDRVVTHLEAIIQDWREYV